MEPKLTARPIPGVAPFAEYAPAYLRIRTKRGTVVPFRLNRAQLKVEEAIAEARAEFRPVRLLILKARQLGFSTWSLGRMYEFTTTKNAALILVAVNFYNADRRSDRVWVFFDENQVLTHVGSTFQGSEVEYAMPWQELHE